MSRNLTELWRLNFSPTLRKIKRDLERWFDLPSSLMGHKGLIKMNIFPRLLFPNPIQDLYIMLKIILRFLRALQRENASFLHIPRLFSWCRGAQTLGPSLLCEASALRSELIPPRASVSLQCCSSPSLSTRTRRMGYLKLLLWDPAAALVLVQLEILGQPAKLLDTPERDGEEGSATRNQNLELDFKAELSSTGHRTSGSDSERGLDPGSGSDWQMNRTGFWSKRIQMVWQ